MSLPDFCKMLAVMLLLLSACQRSPTAGVVFSQLPSDGPRDIVVNSTPKEAVSKEPEAVVPEVIVSAPVPEVIVVPESRPAAEPVQACLDGCAASCRRSAVAACRQPMGAGCKGSCGTIIDPSACSTACSLRAAGVCEEKFTGFCTAKCAEKCY